MTSIEVNDRNNAGITKIPYFFTLGQRISFTWKKKNALTTYTVPANISIWYD